MSFKTCLFSFGFRHILLVFFGIYDMMYLGCDNMFSQTLYEVVKETFLSKNVVVEYDDQNNLSIPYDDSSKSYVEKLFCDLASSDDFRLRFLKQSQKSTFQLQLKDKDEPMSVLFDKVLESVEGYQEGKNFFETQSPIVQGMYRMFQDSFHYDGNFGISLQSMNSKKKCTIKTDIPDYIKTFEQIGLPIQDMRVSIREGNLDFPVEEVFQKIFDYLALLQNSEEISFPIPIKENPSNLVLKDDTGVIDLHELYTKTEGTEEEFIPESNSISDDSSIESLTDMEPQSMVSNEEEVKIEKEGPSMVKTLGEMPHSEAGRSNWFSLLFFLFIDIVAISLGIYLLIL